MTAESSKQGFRYRLNFAGDKPFRIEFESAENESKFQKIQENSKIRTGMYVYLKRLRELSQANVPDSLQEKLPWHFRKAARVLVHLTTDGILIRFDPQSDLAPEKRTP